MKSPIICFFGHHKCGSRFFRHEVFGALARQDGLRLIAYKIEHPPFRFSRADDLDFFNIRFSAVSDNVSTVLMTGNTAARTVEELDRHNPNWRGVRVLRDPRQVLVSSYAHHRDGHVVSVPNSWVWEKLEHDRPVLQRLPVEEGILYELDNISRDVLEHQVLWELNDERLLTIKLEDFASDPLGHLTAIEDFLGVRLPPVKLNRTNANPDARPWSEVWTPRIAQAFGSRYGAHLSRLGYAF
jgi:hypothetical protein